MADKCNFCEEKKPTNHLILNGGGLWLEFCKECGKKETLTNQDNETYTLEQIYEKIPTIKVESNDKSENETKGN
jgi:hypothetical protein